MSKLKRNTGAAALRGAPCPPYSLKVSYVAG
jgi:hypothetical protein